LLAAVGDASRFRNAKAFCQWTGVLPRSHQSSWTQRSGMRMGKAGPARVKRALYQAAEYARRWEPQLAALYFRQMVEYGKSHKQAMEAVMSHLAARVYAMLKEQRAYQVRDHDGQPMSRIEAGHLIHDELFKTTSGLMTASSKAIQPATCLDNCGLRSGILLLDKQHHFSPRRSAKRHQYFG